MNMAVHYIVIVFVSILVSVIGHYNCEYPSIYDFPGLDDYPDLEYPSPSSGHFPQASNGPPKVPTNHHHHHQHHQHKNPAVSTTSTVPLRTTTLRSPPRVNTVPSVVVPFSATVTSRVGGDLNSIQQTQMNELYCLDVLDNLISSQWQEDIDKIPVNDLGQFSTEIKVPTFKAFYSNPESEWIQEEGTAWTKLDKCFRNLVSKGTPRMNQEEIDCLNKLYPDYLSREIKTVRLTEMFINETSKEQAPFKSYYTYFEITEVLFDNKNIDALDGELRAIHEDMLDFYIKTEEDKTKKIFIIEKECEWKHERQLRETNTDDARYRMFGQLVKTYVNRYLVSEILQKWVPGEIIPEYRYDLWSKARETMDKETREKVSELRSQKKDAQFLCTYAAELATKFFTDQKAILFDKMKTESPSANLRTHNKYSYVVALKDALQGKTDNRITRVDALIKEFKEGHYCLTNMFRMVENHQRYMIASTFTNEVLPYGNTFCLIKEMSPGLVNPRYCKCQGTFCEEFGLATVRAERFQLNLLPNNKYTVTTNSSYRILPLDELIESANNRIAQQKFNTWWYRQQKNPPKILLS